MTYADPSWFESFKSQPAFYMLIGAVGAFAIVLVFVAFILCIKAARWAVAVGTLALLLGVLMSGIGIAGTLLARSNVEAALSSTGISAAEQRELRQYGESIANYPLLTGLGSGSLPMFGGGLAALIGIRRWRKKR